MADIERKDRGTKGRTAVEEARKALVTSATAASH